MNARLALVVVAGVAALAAGASRADELDVGGTKRSYELYVPPGAPPKAPLVLVLHGHGGSAHQVREASDFDAQAKKYGFVAAYPDGLAHNWVDGRHLVPKKVKQAPDDGAFLLALIDELAHEDIADPARVYVVGHSNGAIMTLTFACEHADRIAGIGVVAGALPQPMACKPSRPVQAIFFQGTKDPLIPFAGGGVGMMGKRGAVQSADDTVKVFADLAGCTAGRRRLPVDNVKGDGTSLVVEDRTRCTTPIARVIVVGGGHGWPGHKPIFLRHTKEIDATAAMADFFFGNKSP